MAAGIGGLVTPGSTNVAQGSPVTFTITAAPYQRVVAVVTNGTAVGGWFDNASTNVSFTWQNVAADGTLAVTFGPQVARDPGSTPYEWLARYGLTNFDADAMADPDDDGLLTWQERLAGTDPTNQNSSLVVGCATPQNLANGFSIHWPVVPGKTYQVQWADAMNGPWRQDLPDSRLTAGAGQATLVYTDLTAAAATSRFYRVQADTVISPNAVGYVAIRVPPAGGFALCGLNFLPQGHAPVTLEELLGTTQLKQHNLYTLADQVQLWDANQRKFLAVFQKPDGHFYRTTSTSQATNPLVGLGQAFWIQSPRSATAAKTVVLAGSVLTDPVTYQILPAGLTPLASPYSAPHDLNDPDLYWVADGASAHNLYTLADQAALWTGSGYLNLYLRAASARWHYQSGGQMATNAIIPVGGGA